MKDIEASVLKSFILAIYQLDAPLPNTLQAQIKAINIPQDIDKLKDIANSYPPLATSYKQVRQVLNKTAKFRSKGVESLPQYVPDAINTEIDNASREIEDNLIKFDQEVDQNKLILLSQQIFQALNPVKAAKEVIATILSL